MLYLLLLHPGPDPKVFQAIETVSHDLEDDSGHGQGKADANTACASVAIPQRQWSICISGNLSKAVESLLNYIPSLPWLCMPECRWQAA